MAKKEFKFRGYSSEELKTLGFNEFKKLITSRARRSLERGFSEDQKKLAENLRKGNNVKTHERKMVILPEFIGKTINVYNGKSFLPVTITAEMVGHVIGEYALTRAKAKHTVSGGPKKKGVQRK